MKGQRSLSLTELEAFLLGGNHAHDLTQFVREGSEWKMTLQACSDDHSQKVFVFPGAVLEYEEVMLEAGEVLAYPLPLIGADAWPTEESEVHLFCIHLSDLEIAFNAGWPIMEE